MQVQLGGRRDGDRSREQEQQERGGGGRAPASGHHLDSRRRRLRNGPEPQEEASLPVGAGRRGGKTYMEEKDRKVIS